MWKRNGREAEESNEGERRKEEENMIPDTPGERMEKILKERRRRGLQVVNQLRHHTSIETAPVSDR
jgi:hypothetical protein